MTTSPASQSSSPIKVMVLGPLPLLTVTIEPGQGDDPEIHIHAGGQGVWAARMASVLGADVELCVALGGESGSVLGQLIGAHGVRLSAVEMRSASNATYVHDRRDGQRRVVAQEPEPRPIRHELDSLYTAALAAGLRSDAALLTGTIDASALEEGFYRRLVHDLTVGGVAVVTDLAGDQLRDGVGGGAMLAKIAEGDLLDCGYATGSSREELIEGMGHLRDAGAQHVVLSRGELPLLALLEDQVIEASWPQFAVADTRGTGDSQSGAMAVALAGGRGLHDVVRLGAAAGAINVTRRGLGSGERDAIEEHAHRIEIHQIKTPSS